MVRKSLKVVSRAGRFILIVSLLLFFFLAVAGSLLMIRISSSPLEIGFAKQYIESALYDPQTGNHAAMDQVFLFWPNFRDAVYLVLKGGKILNKDNKVILSVSEVSLTVSKAGLVYGRVMPKTIIIKQPQLRITRTEENTIDIGLGADLSSSGDDTDQGEVVARILDALSQPEQKAPEGHPLSRLKSLKVEGARLMVEDHIIGLSWFLPDFDVSLSRADNGLKADMTIDLPAVRGQPSSFGLLLHYDRKSKNFNLLADIRNLDTMILAGKLPSLDVLRDQDLVVNALVHTSFGMDFQPKHFIFKAFSKSGHLYHPKVTKAPVPYKDLSLSAIYVRSTGKFELKDAQITLNDVTLKAGADLVNEDFKSIHGPVRLKIDELKHASIDPLWPEFLRGDSSERWIVQKMADGTFHNIWATADIRAIRLAEADPAAADDPSATVPDPQPAPTAETVAPTETETLPESVSAQGPEIEKQAEGWDFSVDQVEAGFDYENLTVDYRPPLFPVTQAKGTGHFDLKTDTLTSEIESAKIGDLTVTGGKVVLGEVVAVGKGTADISTTLHGPLKEVVAYLSNEPVSLQKKKNIDVKKVKGDADIDLRMIFDTSKPVLLDDMTITAKGSLKDYVLPNVVRQLDLTGSTLAFALADKKVSASGQAQLHNRDIDFEWEEYMSAEGRPYKSKAKAKIVADPNLRQELGVNLDLFLEGSVPLGVDYTTYNDGTAVADVSVDAGPARFYIDPFDYEKPSGEKAQATFKAYFKNEELKEIKNLKATAPRFTLEDTSLAFSGKGKDTYLSSGKVKRFTLDETDARLDFTIDANGQVKMLFDGPFLDARPFLDTEEQKKDYADPPSILSVTAAKMRTADQQTLSETKLYMDIDDEGRFNQLEMDAKVGKGDIYLRFKPDKEGKRKFFMEVTDAGAFLKAFNLYNGMRGGKMTVSGEPIKTVRDRNFKGKAEIRDFVADKAPAMTKLFSILSLPGLMEVLKNDGLAFSRLETEFNWYYRKKGSLLELRDGRTSGNTLGLTFDGKFDNAALTVDVSGTVIPLSGINEIIGKIPLVGDIITGGSGSLFAATYSIKGKMEDPVISANPLSVLTPGILRRILFE